MSDLYLQQFIEAHDFIRHATKPRQAAGQVK